MQEKVYVFGDDNTPGAVKPEGTYIRIYPMRAPAYAVPLGPPAKAAMPAATR